MEAYSVNEPKTDSGTTTALEGKEKASSRAQWLRKGGAAFVDQALFAGSNFIVTWLLARWMVEAEYGAVVVAYTWFVLVQSFYEAIMVAPLSYYGAGKYSAYFRRYLAYLAYGHIFLGGLVTLGFFAAAFLIYRFNSQLLGTAMAGAAVACLFLLGRGLIRQPFYVLSRPQWSAIGGGIYLIVNVAATVALYLTDSLTPFTALVGMGLAGLVATIVQIIVLKPEFRPSEANAFVNRRQLVADHWDYGKWSLSARSLAWVAGNFGVLLMPLVSGFAGSAALRATMNLVQPIFMTNSALMSLLTPTFVRTYRKDGKAGLNRRVRRLVQLAVLCTGSYFLFLAVFGKSIIHLLYAGRYDTEVTWLFVVGIAALPMITTISRVMDAALSGMGRVKLSFQSKIIPTTLTVVLDLLLVTMFGLQGYALESLITATLTMVMVVYLYTQSEKTRAAGTPAAPGDSVDVSIAGEVSA